MYNLMEKIGKIGKKIVKWNRFYNCINYNCIKIKIRKSYKKYLFLDRDIGIMFVLIFLFRCTSILIEISIQFWNQVILYCRMKWMNVMKFFLSILSFNGKKKIEVLIFHFSHKNSIGASRKHQILSSIKFYRGKESN